MQKQAVVEVEEVRLRAEEGVVVVEEEEGEGED